MATTGGIKRKRMQNNTTRDRSRFYKLFATATAAGDLLADGVGPLTGTQLPCAEIHFIGGGAVTFTRPDGSTVGPVTVPAGYVFPGEAIALSGAATNVLVFW